MPQTSVAAPSAASAGALAYPMADSFRTSKVNGQGGAIAYGYGVCRDADDGVVDLPAAAGDVTGAFEGVAFADPTREYNSAGYADGDEMTVVKKGFVWVPVDQAVTQGGAVYLRHTAGGGTVGEFRADADTANAALVPNARWASTTAGAGLAILELL